MGKPEKRARDLPRRQRDERGGPVARIVAVLMVVVAVCAGSAVVAQAQSSSGSGLGALLQGLSPDLQQKLQGMMGGSGSSQTPVPPPQPVVLTPAVQSQGQLAPSQLEMIMSSRLGQEVDQFGYNQVGIGASVTVPQTGAVQDSYVLGPGDTLDISLRGQDSNDISVTVDRNGQVTLPKLAPIPAAGRTLGDFRRDLVSAVRRGYLATQVFVAVDQLRQVSVLVAGDVSNPGVRILTASSSPLDAILLSGGVTKTGSLRNIKLIRDNRIIDIDLYSVLMRQGSGVLENLRDGDRIVIPPIGATVAIAGGVSRPGIYELASGRKAISDRELLEYAAGLTVPGKYTFSVLRQMNDGTRSFVDISHEPGAMIHAGEAVMVNSAMDISLNRVTLVGAVRTPGAFGLDRYQTLHDLVPSSQVLLPGAYVLLGVIERTDPKTLQHEAIPFSPLHVIQGTENATLVSDDRVHILTENGMECLAQVIGLTDPLFRELATQSDLAQQAGQQQSQDKSDLRALAQGTPACKYPVTIPGEVQTPAPTGGMPAASGTMPGTQPGSGMMSMMSGGTMPGMTMPGMTMPGAAVPGMMMPSTGAAPGAMSSSAMVAALQGATGAPGSNGGITQNSAGAFPQANGATMQQTPTGPVVPGSTTPYVPGYPGATLPGAASPSYASPTTPYTGNGTGSADNTMATVPQDLGGFTTAQALFLARSLSQYQIMVAGAVQQQGALMIAPNTTLEEALIGTHGFVFDTDRSRFEVTSVNLNKWTGSARTLRNSYPATDEELAKIIVKPLDTVIFHHVYADRALALVTIGGEVKYPGQYNIMRSEHLSQLLERAGGLTDEAYPYGTVFLRASVAQMEQKAFKREAQDIRSQMFDALIRPQRATSTQTPPSPEAFAALSNMLSQVEAQPALGRVAYTADPAILKAHRDRDPLLEPGDSVIIPKRPSSVSILGEVMQPGTIAYDPRLSVDDYIERAGGLSQFAERSDTIIVFPDGTAHRANDNTWLSFGRDRIPTGSVIMVPRDLTSLRVEDLIVDSTSIFAQLATMTAALSLLSNVK